MGYCPFSKYSDIFGKAGTGVHKFKILDTAMVDYILTILLAFFLAWITGIPLVIMTIIAFIIGIILHALFGVNTKSVKFFGLSCN